LNDPRVFFAAERTLLAWNRTSLTLMAFGFVIERFGLFANMLSSRQGEMLQGGVSFWIGIAFIVLGSIVSTISIAQYRKVLRTLKPIEIPEGYQVNWGVFANLAVAVLGAALIVYLFYGSGL
jgi:putative membrane protein